MYQKIKVEEERIVINQISELDLLTCLIIGEADNQPWDGKVGVAYTVFTRTQHPGHWHWGHNWREVMLCPKQFSCFEDHNLHRMLKVMRAGGSEWVENYLIAKAVYLGIVKSYIGAPTHYHTSDVHPSWADQINYITTIGDHLFYTCF